MEPVPDLTGGLRVLLAGYATGGGRRTAEDDIPGSGRSHHGEQGRRCCRPLTGRVDATPLHAAAGAGPWITITRPPAAPPGTTQQPPWVPFADPFRPLAGLKVLDLTRVVAGPAATRLLGAMGADVLRIDPPQLPELPDAFVDSGFDKRSAEADFRVPAALDAVRRLSQSADVVVTGYRHAGLDRFGLEPEAPVQALDHATGYGLAAAAFALLAERSRSGFGGPLPDPAFRMMHSPYGRLRHVGPPLMADGMPLEYHRPPVRYGSSPLRWE